MNQYRNVQPSTASTYQQLHFRPLIPTRPTEQFQQPSNRTFSSSVNQPPRQNGTYGEPRQQINDQTAQPRSNKTENGYAKQRAPIQYSNNQVMGGNRSGIFQPIDLHRSIQMQTEKGFKEIQDFRAKVSIDQGSNASQSSQGKSLPKGFKNIGNSCYMYSIIETPRNSTLFTEFLQQGIGIDPIKTPVADSLRKLALQQADKSRRVVVPNEFKLMFGSIHSQYKGYQQEDAHEFLLFLLQSLEQELNTGKKIIKKRGVLDTFLKNEGAQAIERQAEEIWQRNRTENSSIVTDLFYGLNCNIVQCLNCQDEIVSFEEFANLSLPLTQKFDYQTNALSLQKLLEMYSGIETILEGYNCSKCKVKNVDNIKKRVYTWKLPKVLIIQLKRFDQKMNRINTEVQFPLLSLDLNKYIQLAFLHGYIDSMDYIYDLTAIIHHLGTCNNGHYYASCKYGNKWLRMDDDNVTELNIEKKPYDTFGSTTPYLLIYTKRSS